MRCAGVAFSAALATVHGRGTPCFSSVILSLPIAVSLLDLVNGSARAAVSGHGEQVR